MFQQVYGVGAITAASYYNKGYQTLDDLLQNETSLTRDQRIGIKFHRDLNIKISRSEVEEIADTVKRAAFKVDPSGSLSFQIAGSYRRGEEMCGDVDIIVAYTPDMEDQLGLLEKIANVLNNDAEFDGFIVHNMRQHHTPNGDSNFVQIHMCMVKLPRPGSLVRRLDILVVSAEHLGGALIYFTGNTPFNRNVRIEAERLGMKLSNHALLKIEPDGTQRVVASVTEKDVFDALGMKFREPTDRTL